MIDDVNDRVFDNDIDAADTNPGEIDRHYRTRYADVDVRTAVSDGRSLKEVVTADPEVGRRWRRPEGSSL